MSLKDTLSGAINDITPIDEIFGPGGMFGRPIEHPSLQAQADFIRRMIEREGGLYGNIQDLLQGSEGNADLAFDAATGEANRLYPGTMTALSENTMDPATLAALDSIKQDRMGGIDESVNDLVTSKINAYRDRGVTSGTTAAGAGRLASEAADPLRYQADTDYQQARLSMPSEMAMQKYNLGAAQGNYNAEALRRKNQALLNTYLDMWKTTAGLGSTAPPAPTDTDMSEALGQIGKVVGSFKGRTTTPPAQPVA